MFNGKIIITRHARERYIERKFDIDMSNVNRQILNELRPLNVRRMIKGEDGLLYVFTKFNNKFVIIEKDGEYIVKTVVRLNTEKRDRLICKLVENSSVHC